MCFRLLARLSKPRGMISMVVPGVTKINGAVKGVVQEHKKMMARP
jgi:hypothetical protein